MEIGENRFRPGPAKAGYQAGLVLRFNLTRRLHLQSELNFAFVNYSIRAEGPRTRSVSLRSERFEIPLQLGAQFRVADSERDSAPKLLKVNFNDDVGIMGGVGFNIRKFFFDFRLSGYARSHVWNTFVSDGVSQRVRVPRNLVYGGSVGFFF